MIQDSTPIFHLSKRWSKWRVNISRENSIKKNSSNECLRIAVVGGGDIGLKNANSVKAASAAKLAAVCDIDDEVLWDLAKRFDVPALNEFNRLLERSDIDAVILSVPHFLHSSLAIQAAKAGKHVMLEKPLGVNLDDATKIVETCQKEKVRLTINFSFRYRPAVELARLLIKDEILGKVCGTQINLFQFKGASYWAGGYTARASGNWRASKEKAGGGVLINTICHSIDILRYCTGLEVERAFSEYDTYASPIEVEDTIVSTFKYDNGAVGSIASSTFWRPFIRNEIIIWGTHGVLIIEENEILKLWSSRKWENLSPGKEHHIKVFPKVDYTSSWIDRFSLAIVDGVPHEITGKDGWIINAIIEAAYKSRDLGISIKVDPFPWKQI